MIKPYSSARDSLTAWMLALPAIALIALTVILPAILSVGLSFTHTDRFLNVRWAGVENYRQAMADPLLRRAILNTAGFALMFVPLNLALSLGLAMILRGEFFGIRFIRSVCFTPVAVSGIVSMSLFRFLLDRDHGPANGFFAFFGFDPIPWLWDGRWAMVSVTVICLWKSAPLFAVIFLAALQAVPKTLYEAATIDGASPRRQFFHVTLPQITPIVLTVVTLSAIGAFRVFEPMFVLTDGGPQDATQTVALVAYRYAFLSGRVGMASAVCILLLIVIVVWTLLLSRLSRRIEQKVSA